MDWAKATLKMLWMKHLFVAFNLIGISLGFYLPGMPPQDYCELEGIPGCKNEVNMYVNSLASVESAIPYDSNAFGLCELEGRKIQVAENIGQVLFGNRIHASAYVFPFMKNEKCVKACDRKYEANEKTLELLKIGALYSYETFWIIDNMPVAWCYLTTTGGKYCSAGIPLGCFVDENGIAKDACQMDPMRLQEPDTFYLFNHMDIVIQYNSGKGKDWTGKRLVRITAEPRSFAERGCRGGALGIPKNTEGSIKISYTYSVTFIANDAIEWFSRWNFLLDSLQATNIQWFSVFNSFVVVLFLAGMIAIIFYRTIRKGSLRRIEPMDLLHGWRSVHGDIFRPPRRGLLLAVLDGTGAQIFWTTTVTLILACAGFLSPANRGALETTAISVAVALASLSGYKCSRLYRSFLKEQWKIAALLSACLVPCILCIIFMILNTIYWVEGSSAAVPFTTIAALLAMYLGIYVPLTFLGAYIGHRRKLSPLPVPVHPVPRLIAPQPCFKHPVFSILIGGILPFGCIFIQSFFILNSIWAHQIYYGYGFLLLTVGMLVLICVTTSILLNYFHLVWSENYHWWWRSFFMSGFTAVYFFIYCVYFRVEKLEVTGSTNAAVSTCQSLLMAVLLFLFCGHVGLSANYWFMSKLYGAFSMEQRHTVAYIERKKANLTKKIFQKCENDDDMEQRLVETKQ